jgi:hypothetical protein
MQRLVIAMVSLMLALPACGDDDDDSALEAGTFQLSVASVNDQCLAGGLDLLFMPTGTAAPYDLANPTAFPAFEDLPTTMTVNLDDPFPDVIVNLVADGDDAMTINDSTMLNVVVDSVNYGDCNADLAITGSVAIVDSDSLTMTLSINATDPQSSGSTCPTFTGPPCTIGLTMTGERL